MKASRKFRRAVEAEVKRLMKTVSVQERLIATPDELRAAITDLTFAQKAARAGQVGRAQTIFSRVMKPSKWFNVLSSQQDRIVRDIFAKLRAEDLQGAAVEIGALIKALRTDF